MLSLRFIADFNRARIEKKTSKSVHASCSNDLGKCKRNWFAQVHLNCHLAG
jgi:hypothetical protein